MQPPSSWVYSIPHHQRCRVLDVQTLWGETLYRVWVPTEDIVVILRSDQVAPRDAEHGQEVLGADQVVYLAAAARIADTMAQQGDTLLAPLEAAVTPLPHQLQALSRAMAGDRVRYLLADEVGLGKTIEAGLIMRELKLRGLIRRTLVIAPKGLVAQWVAEMRTHFGEGFRLLLPEDVVAYRRLAGDENFWRLHDQVVCPLDAVKPIDQRKGWSREQVAAHNGERFDDLVAAGWDLVIMDEAHRLGGSTEMVARYRLGQALADTTPFVLLLSATPHQGKTDAFHRLVALLDPHAFPSAVPLTRERVQPYVIRTEKRRAITARGQPLFLPRETRLIPVSWSARHSEQRLLYEAVTDYVREGYNQALTEKKSYLGFLMILMQRLVTSSTRAIAATLERRLEILRAADEREGEHSAVAPSLLSEEEWADLDGQEQVDAALSASTARWALRNERSEVEALLAAARRTEAAGPDAKAEALLEWIFQLQQEEIDPSLKVLIFTEFVPTQEMLRRFLAERGFSVVCLNGSMAVDERQRAQDTFAGATRVLISTDAGGEGLNLQFCHVVVNYDMPWNPMRLEQRIGRVDRIGQRHAVRALNLALQDTVEYRVREVLEEKLAVILHEFGVDKTGDVLDSVQAGQMFDGLYVGAIVAPETLDGRVQAVVGDVREQARVGQEGAAYLGGAEPIDPAAAQRLIEHPLPAWVERMTTSYLSGAGGVAHRRDRVWDLTWPSGERMSDVVFAPRDAEAVPTAHQLTLDHPLVRALTQRLPHFGDGQALPRVTLPGLPSDVDGVWGLWTISLHAAGESKGRVFPLFLHESGRVYAPTARRIWDTLLAEPVAVGGYLRGPAALEAFRRHREAAQDHGRPLYEELAREYRERLERRRRGEETALAARRRVVERAALASGRHHRIAQFAEQERSWRAGMEQGAAITPDLAPVVLVRIEGAQGRV